MGKPTNCIGENKDADQLRGNREADQHLCFRYSDSTVPLLLKSKVSSSFLCLYRPVCVGPVRKPHCWFSHEAAHKYVDILNHLFTSTGVGVSGVLGDTNKKCKLNAIQKQEKI